MLGKLNRFHGHGSLRFVYRRGNTVRSPLFALKFMPNPRRQTFRCSVVVSKKISKSAVVRNRIRRRLYEIIRGLSPGFNQPYDLLITVFSEQVETLPASDLQKAVTDILRRAKITSKTDANPKKDENNITLPPALGYNEKPKEN